MRKRDPRIAALAAALAASTLVALEPGCARARGGPAVAVAADASPLERLAARELRRYLYLRTGRLPALTDAARLPDARGDAVLVTVRGTAILARLAGPDLARQADTLGRESFVLKTLSRPDGRGRLLVVAGSDPAGALYGAYRAAERMGVRFGLEGDVVPDARTAPALPEADETGRPLFDVRGIQPFHDFPEGPDWWDLDGYKAVLGQLPKLGMNFFGLHTYPEKGPNAEPAVWIGLPGEVAADGRVAAAYPASWQNTARGGGNWGYLPRRTSGFHFGAAALFDRDDYGGDITGGLFRVDPTAQESVEVFDRAGRAFGDAFSFARALGVRTCVGTETPLTVPEAVRQRLRDRRLDPASPAAVSAVYSAIFARIAKAYPIDTYWFWTPEGWTWDDASPAQVNATLTDLRLALEAARAAGAPFRLATCGWVLGPPSDRTLFARALPGDVAVSTINREVGKAPVDPGFARISGRSKWAIPWLEDDPSLTSPQLWAGRMRRDAADARRYGCDGLLGIHWRTRVLSPNVQALARAAWDQRWSPLPPLAEQDGPLTGQYVSFGNAAIAGAGPGAAAVYRDVRDRVFAYAVPVPDGAYDVTLQLVEGSVERKRGRVFDVLLQGRKVAEEVDVFARVGRLRALDLSFRGVAVTGGRLRLDFVDRIHYPAVAGIVIRGRGFVKKINCGGPAVGDYEADWPETERHLPAGDFYADWAASQFGPAAGPEIGALFARLDGRHPVPVTWTDGPGGLVPNPEPWAEVKPRYAFADEMAALGAKVEGAGNRERFAYWLGQLEYMREVARLACLWGELERATAEAKAAPDPAAREGVLREKAFPVRAAMAGSLRAIWSRLLATVGTTGELGTIANWEQHLLPAAWEKPGEELKALLAGAELPEAAGRLDGGYDGPVRIVVPALRTSLEAGEPLRLKVMVLAKDAPERADLVWREMGKGGFRAVPLGNVARGVYRAELPAGTGDLEWYVRVSSGGTETVYPPTAPALCQTVVRLDGK